MKCSDPEQYGKNGRLCLSCITNLNPNAPALLLPNFLNVNQSIQALTKMFNVIQIYS